LRGCEREVDKVPHAGNVHALVTLQNVVEIKVPGSVDDVRNVVPEL
jgi:hypothetical protein